MSDARPIAAAGGVRWWIDDCNNHRHGEAAARILSTASRLIEGSTRFVSPHAYVAWLQWRPVGVDHVGGMNRKPPHPTAVFGACLALFATLPAIYFAWLTKAASCEPDCKDGLVTAQFIVAFVGLVPMGVLFYATVTGRRRLAVGAFVAALLVYGFWGLVNDAATHGWGNL
jgi:hypothetical protein